MNGIERLRQMAEDFKNVKTAEHYAFIVSTWRGRHIDAAIADIADQIERERDAEVADSPYDAILPEDREAAAWVREHGGLERIKNLLDWVVGHCSTKQQLDFDFWLSGRVMHELGFEEDMADRDEVERRLLARLMPEGMEWPVVGGRKVDFKTAYEPGLGALEAVFIYSNGACWVMSHDGIIKPVSEIRPVVLAADGEPLEVGQTVYGTRDLEPVEIVSLRSREYDGVRTVKCKDRTGFVFYAPGDLTHQRPVLDADGVPIKVGDTVYEVGENYPPFIVGRLPEPGAYRAVKVVYPSGAFTSLDPERITHTKPEPPDSWERIEEDIFDGFMETEETTRDLREEARDIVRRCRALAERERGE